MWYLLLIKCFIKQYIYNFKLLNELLDPCFPLWNIYTFVFWKERHNQYQFDNSFLYIQDTTAGVIINHVRTSPFIFTGIRITFIDIWKTNKTDNAKQIYEICLNYWTKYVSEKLASVMKFTLHTCTQYTLYKMDSFRFRIHFFVSRTSLLFSVTAWQSLHLL